MFALKSRMEYTIRVFLIAAILFNALIPTAASAMSLTNEPVDSSSLLAASSMGIKRSAYKISASSRSSRTALQDATPSATATNMDVPTPVPSETVTSEITPTPSETLAPSATLEPSATSTPTVIASPLGTQIAAQTVVAGQAPVLSFQFSVASEQAAPGDEVIFTIEVVNVGSTPATGLSFSNILPQEFGNGQSGFKDFNFDPQTRLLTWNGAQAGVTTLAPGQIITLEYAVRVDAQLDEVQLIDSASFAAVGLPEPLLSEATLSILSAKKHLTMLDSKGGKALGLDGRVEINLPRDAIHTPRGLLIQDLNESVPVETD